MNWCDRYGHPLQYGDYVEDLNKRYIGQIVHGSINDAPMVRIIKKFNYRTMQYENIGNGAANACYEREFLPSRSAQQRFHFLNSNVLDYIELIQHGERNRRIKDL